MGPIKPAAPAKVVTPTKTITSNTVNTALQKQIAALNTQLLTMKNQLTTQLADSAARDAELKAQLEAQLKAAEDASNAAEQQAAATRYAADVQAASEASRVKAERESAYAVLESQFTQFGLGTLAKTVKDLIISGVPSSEVTMKLRATPEYKARFAGNVSRQTAGLNVYDEATYLELENSMAEVFTAYGQQSLLGPTRETAQAKFATFIGGTIAPTEVKRRLQVATELAASDNATKQAIKQLYPMITDSDIVGYFLDPKEALPKLEVKAQAAQIGGAFLRQGLATDVTSAEEYASMGVDKAKAEAGAAAVAEVLPRGEFLSDITAGASEYTQKTAEDVYLKGLASAKRAQDQLRQSEIARFAGSSGTSKVSLAQDKII